MTTTPLSAALLGLDDGTSGYSRTSSDPRYGPARRKLALAASLAQQASDTSPTTPFGGLARALTAIPSALLGYYGNKESEDLTSQSKSQADDLIKSMQDKPIASLVGGSMPPQTQEAPPPPAPVTGGGSGGVALGMRQNNPGNLTFAGQPGASATEGNQFATFPNMPTGVAAHAAQLVINQQQHGVDTVRGQVTRWVSDPKADLTSYIANTAKAIGVGPDDKVDWTNPQVQTAFILAQQPHESGGGGAKLDPADVQKGVQLYASQRGQNTQTAAGVTPSPVAARTGEDTKTLKTSIDFFGNMRFNPRGMVKIVSIT